MTTKTLFHIIAQDQPSPFQEQFNKITADYARSYHDQLGHLLQTASDTRAGQCLPPEQHGPHLQHLIAPGGRISIYTYDGLPLLQIEHWPDPATTDHLSCLAKFTRLPPDAPFPSW